ncbi:MAG: substrate-binding domain-containing protein [Clostridiales bacterium]|nr:substrate-binding domain-containing protein [Clostridiales bacterium]
MKKLFALLLAVCLGLSLVACGGGTTPDTSATPPASGTAKPSADVAPTAPLTEEEMGLDPLDKVGFYDPEYDYTQNEKFKVAYMTIGMTVFNNDFDKSYAHWANLSNVDYTGIWSATDNDSFLTQIRAFKDQGYDGLLMDADMMIYPSIAQICDEIGMHWMGGMGQALKWKEDGTPDGLVHPYVGFDHVTYGVACGEKLLDHAAQNWPDVALSDIGFLSIDMALSPPLHQRVEGAMQAWKEAGVPEGNMFIADIGGDMTLDAAQNVATAQLTTNAQFDYWLVIGVIDDFAQGAANALENLGIEENACVVTVGGTMLREAWDEGRQSAWRYAYNTPNTIYGEPIFFALYAFMSGQATPETIWPSWINHDATSVEYFGDTYAQLLLPSYWMEYETYKTLFGWADVYAQDNSYGYPTEGIARDLYPSRVAIPEFYKG